MRFIAPRCFVPHEQISHPFEFYLGVASRAEATIWARSKAA